MRHLLDKQPGRSQATGRTTQRLEQGEWALAAASFAEAVTMARAVRLVDADSETGLALAKVHLGQLTGDDARSEAERLAGLRDPAHRWLARLWLAVAEAETVARASRPDSTAADTTGGVARGSTEGTTGGIARRKLQGTTGGTPVLRDDLDRAKEHALAAYTWAWADGEPYVNRYELTKTTELLHELGVPIPNLPPYDPAKDVPFPWEADVHAAIEKLRAQKATEKKAKTAKKPWKKAKQRQPE